MSTFNKVPASAGAEWLLGAFALLRKAPLGLASLGLIWGALSLLVVQLMASSGTAGLLLQLGLSVLGPLLFAGMVWAVHEVDHDRAAEPAQLLYAFRSERIGSLLATLLPQIVAVLALALLLFAMIGPAQLQQLAEVMSEIQRTAQAGGQPDPALVGSLPVGRLFLWMLLMFGALLAIALCTFIAVPDIVLGGSGGLAAMRNSFGACIHNLAAVAVFAVLLLISLVGIMIMVQLVAMLVQLAAGPTAGVWVANLLLMAVLMPLLAGSAYHAWRQLVGPTQGVADAAQARFEA